MGVAPSSLPDLKTECPPEFLNERLSSLKPPGNPSISRARLEREACALFMPDKVGADLSEEEREEELGEKMDDYFLNKGPCKELFIALRDFWEANGTVGEFLDIDMAIKKCMIDHSDYYHPFLNSMKTLEEEEEMIDRAAAAAKQGTE